MAKKILHLFAQLGYGGAELSIFEYYKQIDKSKLQFDFVHYGGDANYHAEIEKLGGHIFTIEAHSKVSLYRYGKALKKIIRENGPYHSIHIHPNYMSGYLAMVACFLGVKRRVVHIHGMSTGGEWTTRLFPFLRFLITVFGTQFIAVSKAAGNFYFPNKKYSVVHTAVDLNDYFGISAEAAAVCRASLGCGPDTLLIGHVGRFDRVKNHAFLLEMAKELRAAGKDFRLIFVGDGQQREPMQARVLSEGLNDQVQFLGYRKDISLLMKSFDLVVLPSFSEGLPGVVMQAQAAATPCIISDTITHEVDMGLGLVTFLSIDQASRWAEYILNGSYVHGAGNDEIKNAFVKNGFELYTAAKEVERQYLNE